MFDKQEISPGSLGVNKALFSDGVGYLYGTRPISGKEPEFWEVPWAEK